MIYNMTYKSANLSPHFCFTFTLRLLRVVHVFCFSGLPFCLESFDVLALGH